jgi:5-methyltetrahydrofolate--homocysteine methyltransferase
MNSRGVAARWPVLLGGAALTRAYVERDLGEMYHGDVRYARDAFEGLRLMDALVSARRSGRAVELSAAEQAKAAERRARHERSVRIAEKRRGAAELADAGPLPARSDVAVDVPVPTPPFWGDRVVKGIALADYSSMLDERATFMGQWGLRGSRSGRSSRGPSYEELVETQGRPRLRYWLDRLQTEGVLEAAVVYGYFRCVGEGDDTVLLDDTGRDRCRFTFPRQRRDRRLCISDFFRPRESGETDVVAFQVVTMGARISEYTAKLFESNAYRDYLEVHGLSVQLTEALAEYWHARVRQDLGLSGQDSPDLSGVLDQGYQGSRYSFGYPACPNLEDQDKIMELLEPGRIGVALSEESQLHPEQSTSAIVVHHPEAKYFNAK